MQSRSSLLQGIGQRVRALRESMELTQRGLADRSGVSPRFLAQLEGGDANISVERLAEVARALGVPLGSLVEGRADLTAVSPANRPEWMALHGAVSELIDARDLGELKELRRWMEVRFARRSATAIALLGLRGAGKSSIGKKLATRLGLRFVELDAEIEQAAGLSLAEIFTLHGEAYYRRLERETLLALLADGRGMVLATGGSLVNDRETYRLLRRRAITIWLKARPEDHWNRVIQQGDQRPMAQHPHAMAELRALLAARERLYEEAEHVVDTSELDVDGAVDSLARQLTGSA